MRGAVSTAAIVRSGSDRRFSIYAVTSASQVFSKGEVGRIILAVGLVALLVAVGVTVAFAAKPGNGRATGEGTVFFLNPVAQLQDQSLTDQKDADYPALAAAYRKVTLTNLDGSGRLVGDWANIVSETGTRRIRRRTSSTTAGTTTASSR